MNFRKKITILGAAVCCACTGIVGGASLAWFRTRDDITITNMVMEFQSTEPAMQVALYIKKPDMTNNVYNPINENKSNSLTIPTTLLHDYSSKFGETFYTKSEEGVYDVAANADGIFEADVTIRAKKFEGSRKIQLTARALPISELSYADRLTATYLRIGFYETDSTFTNPIEDGVKVAFVKDNSEWVYTQYVDTVEEQNVLVKKDNTYHALSFSEFQDVCDWPYLTEVTHYFKLHVWMEGTPMDDQGTAYEGRAKVEVQVKAIEPEPEPADPAE